MNTPLQAFLASKNVMPDALHINADDVRPLRTTMYPANDYNPAYTVRTIADRRQQIYVSMIIEGSDLICYAAGKRGVETCWDVEDRARDMYREILAERKMQREAA